MISPRHIFRMTSFIFQFIRKPVNIFGCNRKGKFTSSVQFLLVYHWLLIIHQTHQTNFRMGTGTTNSIECLSRRLDHYRQYCRSGSTTNVISRPETRIVRLDNQLHQINSDVSAINRIPRFLIGYYNYNSTTTREETEGLCRSIQRILKNPIQSPCTIFRYLSWDSCFR